MVTSIKTIFLIASVAVVSLFSAVSMNLSSLGRADKELMKLVGELLRHQINCREPQKSALFSGELSLLNHSLKLEALLYHRASGDLIAYYPKTYSPSLASAQDLVQKSESKWLKPQSWVVENDICDQGWTLFAKDKNNLLFEKLIFARQRTMYLFTSLGFSLLILSFAFYLSFKGKQATTVLRSFGTGKLDARLNIYRWEQSFELLHEFNRMANKLSQLFSRIKKLERSRSELISELAHDTRTPLASLRSGIDTFQEFGATLNENQKTQLLNNLNSDLEYFSRLVDDLFLLAELDSKSERLDYQLIDLPELLQDLAHKCGLFDIRREVILTLPKEKEAFELYADLYFLKRLLVNLLTNAKNYSLSKIEIALSFDEGMYKIEISNDSLILSEQAITSWGKRKRIRRQDMDHPSENESLGLGSSIACRIAEIHGGQVSIKQIQGEDPSLSWVSVKICLPARAAAVEKIN